MTIEAVAKHLAQCHSIAVLSGAGISAESGVPTFREAQTGLWSQFNPHQLATPRAFRRDPNLVWSWYMHRYDLVQAVEPNPGHFAVAELEELFDFVAILTQNVDGLHHIAGSTDVVELHGNIQRFKCFDCERSVDLTLMAYDKENAPACPHCKEGLVRPSVVWFEENLPQGALHRAIELAKTVDAMIVVGTSGVVEPVASLPGLSYQNGATIIEVNPNETTITPIAEYVLRGPSGEILPKLVEHIRKEKNSHA